MQRRRDDYKELPPGPGPGPEGHRFQAERPSANWRVIQAAPGGDSEASARRPAVVGLRGWLAVAMCAAFPATAAWLLVRPTYRISGEIGCAPAEPGIPIEYREILSALESPPRASMIDAAGQMWTYGELLSLATVQCDADPVRAIVRVTVETSSPGRARELCEQWVNERLASIDEPSDADRVLAVLDSIDVQPPSTVGVTGHYRRSIFEMRELHGKLRGQAAVRRKAHAKVDNLKAQPPPKGHVADDELHRALQADVALQQDLRHLHARSVEIRNDLADHLSEALQAFTRIVPLSGELTVQLDDLREKEGTIPVGQIVTPLTDFAREFVEQGEILQGALAGTLAVLDGAAPEDARTTLEIIERLDDVVHEWTRSTKQGLDRVSEVVESLSEGRETSVRQVLIQNQLKRLVFSLRLGVEAVADGLANVSLRSNFRLDAHAKSVRGLLVRTSMRRCEITERLQAEADAEARAARQAESARLEQELEAAREIEQETMGRFLVLFDTLMSLENQALAEVVGNERRELLQEVRHRLQGAVPDPLAGIVFTAGPFVVDPRRSNQSQRVLLCSAFGAGGATASLVVLVITGLARRWTRR